MSLPLHNGTGCLTRETLRVTPLKGRYTIMILLNFPLFHP